MFMQSINKFKNYVLEYQKIIKTTLFILCLPISLTVLNYILNTILNLGTYTGTFLRFLYDIVVYY